jgi:hypothetical protein
LKAAFDETFEVLVEKLESWEDCERFVEPMRAFSKSYMEKGLKTFSPNKGAFAFNVLNHADFHINNIMYKMKEDGAKIEDFIIVRFILIHKI